MHVDYQINCDMKGYELKHDVSDDSLWDHIRDLPRSSSSIEITQSVVKLANNLYQSPHEVVFRCVAELRGNWE